MIYQYLIIASNNFYLNNLVLARCYNKTLELVFAILWYLNMLVILISIYGFWQINFRDYLEENI
jgi:hypothetical protein